MFYIKFSKWLSWFKKSGSPLYWSWVLSIGLVGGAGLFIWLKDGWCLLSAIILKVVSAWYIVSILPVYFYEKKYKSNKNQNINPV